MGTCSWLATLLDQEMIESPVTPVAGTAIFSRTTSYASLPLKTGMQVAQEIGGRLLLRYLLPHQVGSFVHGDSALNYVTPTPYTATETISWLALPKPLSPRPFVLLLDPTKISKIKGPRWVKFGKGIEYLLPEGFPASALRFPWEVQIV